MPARLFSQWGDTRGISRSFDEELTIGRRETNGLVLDFAAVSGEHARIHFDPEENSYMVEDLGSLNGPTVDGIGVTEPMRLDRLHVLKFGRVCEFVFQILAEDPSGAGRGPAEAPIASAETRLIDVQIPPAPPVEPGETD